MFKVLLTYVGNQEELIEITDGNSNADAIKKALIKANLDQRKKNKYLVVVKAEVISPKLN